MRERGIPHRFIHGNLLFGAGSDDVWAGFRIAGVSYPGMSSSKKIELKEQIESLVYSIDADFQLIRASRPFSAAEYVARARTTIDAETGHREDFEQLLAEHYRKLRDREVIRPQIFMFVRLKDNEHSGFGAGLAQSLREIASLTGVSDSRAIGPRELRALRLAEERAFERVYGQLRCERMRSGEIAELIRGAYTRGLGPPRVDENWMPQAIALEAHPDHPDEGPVFEPVTFDVLRLHNSYLEVGSREIRLETEAGEMHQALLTLGTLPDAMAFPGQAELLFRPMETGFPVDVTLSASFLPNREARKLAAKRKVDADMMAREESMGAHGPGAETAERPVSARELESRLSGSDRPPLLRVGVTLALCAPDREELERRVAELREAFGRTELHRPAGDQHRLFLASMPARPFPLREYCQHMLPDQVAALMPIGISHGASEVGPYIGHGLTGARQPIQFDLAEACRQNRPPTVLLTGSLGAGKTMLLQYLLYTAYLQGSTPICDIDPKGDHNLHELPGVAEDVEQIILGPDAKFKGRLDPMRVAGEGIRGDLTYAFLMTLVGEELRPEQRTEVKAAVSEAIEAGASAVGSVLELLGAGNEMARAAARALEVHLSSGLAQLGYAEPGQRFEDVGSSQILSFQIRDLTLPTPGTKRSEMQEDERIGQAVLRLLAAYAMNLCSATTRHHSVLALDEAWSLLSSDGVGQQMLARFARQGRSMNITPILASQIVGDASALAPLIGTYIALGVETAAEASAALELLHQDVGDPELIAQMTSFRRGRGMQRDTEGGVYPFQADPGARLLAAFDTTPGAGVDGDGEEIGEGEPSDAAAVA